MTLDPESDSAQEGERYDGVPNPLHGLRTIRFDHGEAMGQPDVAGPTGRVWPLPPYIRNAIADKAYLLLRPKHRDDCPS